MHWVRSGRRKVGWTAAVAVVIALFGHALLMAGGGHPAEAAHSRHASMVASSHAMHSPDLTPAASDVDGDTTVKPHPTGSDPGDPAAGCDGLLALAWPQPQPTPSSGSAPVVLPPAVDLVVLPAAKNRVAASRLDPTDPPGTRRALLQIYRL